MRWDAFVMLQRDERFENSPGQLSLEYTAQQQKQERPRLSKVEGDNGLQDVVLSPPCVRCGADVCGHTNVKMNDMLKNSVTLHCGGQRPECGLVGAQRGQGHPQAEEASPG